MSALSHPNLLHNDPDIIPGAVSQLWVDDRRDEYGENSPIYKATVLGKWPDQSEDSMIDLRWVGMAQKPDPNRKPDGRGAAIGLDVAGEGGDLTVLSLIRDGKWQIPTVNGKTTWHRGKDVMQAVKLVQDTLAVNPDVRVVTLDDTGLGQGVAARLKELQGENKIPRYAVATDDPFQYREVSINIVPRNFGASAYDADRFADEKDELWWAIREAFRNYELKLPTEHELNAYGLPKGNDLVAQLTTAIYCTVGGRIEVYDKRSSRGGGSNQEIKLRIKQLPAKSPDLAHSLLLAWDGYKRLRPMRVWKAPETTFEIERLQRKAIMDRDRERMKARRGRGHRPGGMGADRRDPWKKAVMR